MGKFTSRHLFPYDELFVNVNQHACDQGIRDRISKIYCGQKLLNFSSNEER